MSTPTQQATEGELRAWGWVRHLRAGGTTPWSAWTDHGRIEMTDGRLLPGAQQLELLRRLNLVGRPDPTLVGRVLSASAPGRGRPDLELEGAVERLAFGPRPVDPAGLSSDELLRVATLLLAEDLVAAGPAEPEHRAAWPRRTSYRLAGDPWLTRAARPELIHRRRPPALTDRPERLLVLGADLGTMLADLWSARAFGDGVGSWKGWLGDLVRHDRLPPRIDLPAVARSWQPGLERAQIHLVLDPGRLAGLVGLRRPVAAPSRPSADAVELARLTVAPLGMLVTPGPRAALLRDVLLPRLAGATGPSLTVPEKHHDWVHLRAEQMRGDLGRSGYPVHGDLEALLPDAAGAGAGTAAGPDPGRVLDLALGQLVRRSV